MDEKSPYSQLGYEILRKTENVLIKMTWYTEGVHALHGDFAALQYLSKHSAFDWEDFSLIEKVLLTAHQDTVQFARLDLMQLHPEKKNLLQREALIAAIDYHLISSFFNPRYVEVARQKGLLPERSFTFSP